MDTYTQALVRRLRTWLTPVFILTAITFTTAALAQEDLNGSKDHPLISRYEGSFIKFYTNIAFDEYPLYIGAVSTNKGIEGQPESVMWLEGNVTKLLYVNPAERSALEVYKNYEKALAEAGFETIFSCKKKACGGHYFKRARDGYMWLSSDNLRYLAAKLPRDDGDVYVSLLVSPSTIGGGPDYQRTVTELQIVEVEPIQENMVTVDANAMEKGLGEEGRIALYGIFFDVDKATIKPESKPTLEQISTLLGNNPKLKIVIVGHTDNQGELSYNRDLSTQRAKSVEAALVGDYGIKKDRLSAWGVGYLSPMASNKNEAGRAKNRRVELVEE
jgi:OOP family OmpA-OmpF porin